MRATDEDAVFHSAGLLQGGLGRWLIRSQCLSFSGIQNKVATIGWLTALLELGQS